MYDKEGLVGPICTLPPQEPLPVLEKLWRWEGLGEHVGWLLICSNVMETVRGAFALRVMQELKIFGIDVLGPGASLRELGNGQSTTGVNET